MATPAPILPNTKSIVTTYEDLTEGRRCANPECGKVISEGAAIKLGVVRIRCRHCKQLNVITEVNHYIAIDL